MSNANGQGDAGIDVTAMETPALHAALQERKAKAEEIIAPHRTKAKAGQNPLHLLGEEDWGKVKALHGDAQMLQTEINRRAEMDGAAADFERIGKAATNIAGMPQPEGPAGGDFGPITPGQAFVTSKGYQDLKASGAFSMELREAIQGGVLAPFIVPLGYKSSFPQHRRLLQRAAKAHPEFFTKGTAINSDAASGGGFTIPEYDLDPEQLARASLDVVGLLRIQPTDKNVIEWLRQVTRITGATTVGEFTDTSDVTSGKPEGGATWERETMNVRTIAVHVAVTNQQLDDAPEIRTVIDEDLRFEIDEELNAQCLTGNGAGTNLTGILQVLTDESVPDVDYDPGTPTHDNILDALLDAWVQIRIANEPAPTGVLLYMQDWYRARTLKADGTGEYLMGPPGQMGASVLWDIPLVGTTNIAEGTGLMGNFQMARLHVRQESQVRLGWAHNDFLANRVRLLAELRAALTVRRPGAFRRVTGLDS